MPLREDFSLQHVGDTIHRAAHHFQAWQQVESGLNLLLYGAILLNHPNAGIPQPPNMCLCTKEVLSTLHLDNLPREVEMVRLWLLCASTLFIQRAQRNARYFF